jgi:drug/metabolite transporter (DMT)-like permease
MASLLVLFGATLYGISPILAKVAYASGVTPLTLLALRSSFGAIVIWIGLVATRSAMPLGRLPLLLVLGLTILPAQVFSYFYALSVLPASTAAVIANTSPIHVAWLSRIFLQESLQLADITILVAVVSGAVLIAGQTPHFGHALGAVALAVATLLAGVYLVTQRHLVRDIHPLGVLAVMLPASAAVYWTAGLMGGQIQLAMPHPAQLAVAASSLSGAIAGLCVLVGLRAITATRTALLGMLEPVVAVVCSVMVLGDEMTAWRAVGIFVVLAGITLLQVRRFGEEPQSS